MMATRELLADFTRNFCERLVVGDVKCGVKRQLLALRELADDVLCDFPAVCQRLWELAIGSG